MGPDISGARVRQKIAWGHLRTDESQRELSWVVQNHLRENRANACVYFSFWKVTMAINVRFKTKMQFHPGGTRWVKAEEEVAESVWFATSSPSTGERKKRLKIDNWFNHGLEKKLATTFGSIEDNDRMIGQKLNLLIKVGGWASEAEKCGRYSRCKRSSSNEFELK